MLHGYSLAFRFVFETDELDYRNWVVDFGGLKGLKLALQHHFDHKTVVAQDDPHLTTILALQNMNIADVVIVPAVGCEKFAEVAANLAREELKALGIAERVRVVEVECFEHGANSAIYRP
jgi:6-pyruvoyltetrahydropterin/6-carboxytetrahydropterin synthase